jgi:hypothetical protein
MRYPTAAVASLLLLSAGRAFGQGPLPIGGEIHVNTYTTHLQLAPSIAADASGRFVVVWESHGQDDPFPGAGVFAQRYDASGTPLGGEFQVNTYTTGYQYQANVASDPSGAFVVVWRSQYQGLLGRRYDATGTPGAEFLISFGDSPDVAMDGAGGFVVVWRGSDAINWGIFGRRYDGSGAPQGPAFRVNTYTSGVHDTPSVATDAAGNFVVVWNSHRPYSGVQIDAQIFDAEATAVGDVLHVTPPLQAPLSPYSSGVAMDANGTFVVVWNAYDYLGASDVFGQRYDATGATVGSPFRVNSYTTWVQEHPVVASDAAGNFLVLWQSHHDGYPDGIFGQGYDASGVPVGGEFQVNSYWTGVQYASAVAAGSVGSFVTAWTSEDAREGVGQPGIFAQRFGPDLIFRDGLETGTLVAWSGSNTDAGDLAVSGAAAMGATTHGLVGVVDDTVGLYVQDDTPEDERRYRARFYIDTNGFDPGEGLNHQRTRTLLVFSEAPARRVAAVVLRRVGGDYAVMGRARQDDNSQADTGFFPISDGPHAIEIDLVRASGPDALDGTFELFIDGVSMGQLTVLDNSLAEVDFTRMGALSVKTGASGTMYWDEFESRRGTYIGLLP